MKWFINEDGNVYRYDPNTQPIDFPGDYPVAFDTMAAAMEASETVSGWLSTDTGPPCPHCGVATDDEGESDQIGTLLAVCMNLDCAHFGRYVEVRNA